MEDPFQIFGFSSPRLNLDINDLEARYHRLAREFHPDKNSNSSEDQAAEINRAYKILKDPWKRTEFLTRDRLNGQKVPVSLAELFFDAEGAGDRRALEDLRAQLMFKKKARGDRLNQLFRDYDSSSQVSTREEALRLLAELVSENKYSTSMERDIEAKLQLL